MAEYRKAYKLKLRFKIIKWEPKEDTEDQKLWKKWIQQHPPDNLPKNKPTPE